MAFSLIRWIFGLVPFLHHFRFLFSTSFLFVIVYALYEAAMIYFAGGTVGKLIVKLEVEKERGSMSFGDCLIRGVMKAFSAADLDPGRVLRDSGVFRSAQLVA